MACPSPGGGGAGGRGETMPRLRRGERRERASEASGAPGRQPAAGGLELSEAPASASPRPDAAGGRAWLRQPPPPPSSPPPPAGGPSKSLDLGEDPALSGIASGAGRIPREPSQVMGTPSLSSHVPAPGSCPPRRRPRRSPGLAESKWESKFKIAGRAASRATRSRGAGPAALLGARGPLCRGASRSWEGARALGPAGPGLLARWELRMGGQRLLVFFNPGT